MLKKSIIFISIITISMFLFSCNIADQSTTVNSIVVTMNAYETWLNSDEAIDLNKDRKIDEADYDLFLLENNYANWRSSDEAIDINEDKIIDETDYELYLTVTSFEYWKVSDDALDLNGDRKIDEDDYFIYLEYKFISGDYYIDNYTYTGSEYYYLNDNIAFTDLGEYLNQITITVTQAGDITLKIPTEIRSDLEASLPMFIEGANNMTISRISPFIVVIDTSATYEDLLVNFTLYLDEIENGFSTSYVISFFDDDPFISFDILKVE